MIGLPYMIGGAAIVLALCYGVGNVSGRLAERAKCDSAAVRAELATAKKDLTIQKTLAAAARAERTRLAAVSEQLDAKVTAYEKELAKRPAPSCAATDADVRWLRNIR